MEKVIKQHLCELATTLQLGITVSDDCTAFVNSKLEAQVKLDPTGNKVLWCAKLLRDYKEVEVVKRKEKQLELLHQVQGLGYNIVTCGNCSEVIIHKTDVEQIQCPDCGFKSDPCDFPDLHY